MQEKSKMKEGKHTEEFHPTFVDAKSLSATWEIQGWQWMATTGSSPHPQLFLQNGVS